MSKSINESVNNFFASLYANEPHVDHGATHEDNNDDKKFNGLVNRLVANKDGHASTGDQALQNLMFNYILSSPENIEKGKQLTAVLGNIQRSALKAFAEKFPTTNVDSLITAARNDGYHVEVLKAF